VSVVLPTYNQARYLPDAIASVFAQSETDLELIVVNDGSTDDSAEVLASLRDRWEFQVVDQANQGVAGALNSGFSRARGRYLTWTSSDNVMEPNMLARLAATLDANPRVGLAYADWTVIDDRDAPLGAVRTFDFDRLLLMRVNYVNACFLYRRECQDAIGLYDPAFAMAEDWEYWWRLAQRFVFVRVPELLYRYRLHDRSLTATVVTASHAGRSAGYDRLYAAFRRTPAQWYHSKARWEWLRLRLGHDPTLTFRPWQRPAR